MSLILRIADRFTLCLLSVSLFLSAIAPAHGENRGDILIGSILILTGESAHYGVAAKQGAELAIDEINAGAGIHGRKLRFIWEDETGGRADRAVAAYKKLTSVDKVKFIFGPSFQDGLMAIAPLAKRDTLFIITPSTPSLSLPNVFSTWIDPKVESNALAEFVRKKYKRVAILGEQQSWVKMVTEQFSKSFKSLGGEISVVEEPLAEATDLKTEVLRAKESKPDAIFIPSYPLFPKYIKAAAQQKLECPIFSIEIDNTVVQAAGKSAEGTISIGPSIPATDFVEKFQSRFGTDPDSPAFQAYDAVMLLAAALREKGADVAAVQGYFKNFKEFSGVSGVISNQHGDIFTSMGLFVARNGKLRKLQDL